MSDPDALDTVPMHGGRPPHPAADRETRRFIEIAAEDERRAAATAAHLWGPAVAPPADRPQP